MQIMPELVFIGLGSNIGDKSGHLNEALQLMNSQNCRLQNVSDFCVTEPVTPTIQDFYLNAVAMIETDLNMDDFFEKTLEIEHQMGRKIKGNYQERCIDIDILLFGDRIYESKTLIVPHPKFHQRSFVLIPFNQISPETQHPIWGVSVRQLYHQVVWGVYT